jgi:hypothetical protein
MAQGLGFGVYGAAAPQESDRERRLYILATPRLRDPIKYAIIQDFMLIIHRKLVAIHRNE